MTRIQPLSITPPPDPSRFFVLVGRVSFVATLLFSILGFLGLARAVEYRIAAPSIPVMEMVMALISAGFLVTSFLSRHFREHIYQYLLILIYAIISTSVFRLYASGFHSELAYGSIIVTLLGCLFFFDRFHLLVYQLFAIVLILIAALMTSDPLTGMWMYAFRFLVFHTVAHLAISFRIQVSRELREKDIRFRHLFEQLHDGVMYIDPARRIQLVNDQMATLSGYPAKELIDQSILELLPEWDQWTASDTDGLETMTARMEVQLTRKEGSRIWVSCSLTGIKDEFGRPDGYVAILTDISDSRRSQVELRRTAEKLSRTNQELEQFSYFASHDLQAPLETIRHFSQQLLGQTQKEVPFSLQEKESLEIILENTSRMNKLVNALLLYSSSGVATTDKVEVDMNQVVAASMENLAAYIEESGATVQKETLPELPGDPIQLTRLMQNLIGNAILYRKEEPLRIEIAVSLNESASAHIFSVRDNGIGIDSKDYERVFKMFQQIGPESNSGPGIGLAICKRIIDNHGGSIWLKSIKGQGTTIFFSLPVY